MMAKREDLEVAFEEEAEQEFVREADVPPEEPTDTLPEEAKKKTKAELFAETQALRAEAAARPDSSAAVVAGLEKLAEKLKPAEAAAVAQQPGETEEQFVARLKVDLFDETKVGPTLREAVLRYVGPVLQQQNSDSFSTAMKLMELDPDTGPTFKRYKAETLTYLRANFRGYETSPRALELAFQQVRSSHVQDIAEELAQKRLAELRKAEGLEEKPAGAAPPARRPMGLEAGSAGGTSGVAPRRVTVVVTPNDEREAESRGVSPEAVARQRMRQVAGR
jgi:hypothetical protein